MSEVRDGRGRISDEVRGASRSSENRKGRCKGWNRMGRPGWMEWGHGGAEGNFMFPVEIKGGSRLILSWNIVKFRERGRKTKDMERS